ncbi:hypothetical protein [Calothrix sp. PCC 6303]|uniref:hypothetical protein n=1 Tax=Calothrix sp. PCC 6303 TaxID=1170562 RepID=UPI0002A0040C|nr:hypothetical protein [Calothrix sp. PCC 6303]AFZ02980.1 hypothetical protein Cal6303_4064 [Calothrix sp. PCC 6303]
MKTKEVHIRISQRRFNKLKNYAATKEKTVTQIIEDYIDRLPTLEIDKNSTTALSQQPAVDID